jgi:sugar phosphate permease
VVVFGSLAIPATAALAVALLIGGIRSVGGPARSKLTDAFSSRTDLGVNFAVITVGTMVGSALAPPLFGAIIDYVAVGTAFFVIGAITFLAALVTVAVLHTYGDRASVQEPTPVETDD